MHLFGFLIVFLFTFLFIFIYFLSYWIHKIPNIEIKCRKVLLIERKSLTIKISSLRNFSSLRFTSCVEICKKNVRIEQIRIVESDWWIPLKLTYYFYVDWCVKAFKRIFFLYVCKDLRHEFSWSQFLSDFNNQGLIREIKIFYACRSSCRLSKNVVLFGKMTSKDR